MKTHPIALFPRILAAEGGIWRRRRIAPTGAPGSATQTTKLLLTSQIWLILINFMDIFMIFSRNLEIFMIKVAIYIL
mgnify:CR=1 FL=1